MVKLTLEQLKAYFKEGRTIVLFKHNNATVICRCECVSIDVFIAILMSVKCGRVL